MSFWLDEAFYKCRELNRYLDNHRFDNSEEVLAEVKGRFDYIFDAVYKARSENSDTHSRW